jgi:hypothetical protein
MSFKNIFLAGLLAFCAVSLYSQQPREAYYVHAEGSDDNGGLSATDPFRTLARAAGAEGAGLILVMGELNEESEGISGDRESVFRIAGKRELVIRGFDSSAALNARNSGKRVLRIDGTDVWIENIAILDGSAEFGGGLYIGRGASLTLGNGVLVSGCRAETDGGAAMINEGKLVLTGNARLGGNSAGDDGGGVYARGGILILDGSSCIENNSADCGGGVCIDDGSSFVMKGRPMVRSNTASGSLATGGGLCVGIGSAITMKGGSVIDNRAGWGAGVYNAYGSFTLDGGLVSGNIAENEGGGICARSGTVVLNAGSITYNRAASGGGLYGPLNMLERSDTVVIRGNIP